MIKVKLRVIAKDSQMKKANLELKKENKFYLPDEEFEISDEKGKELLNTKWEGNPIVEEVKEQTRSKNKAAAKNETAELETNEEE